MARLPDAPALRLSSASASPRHEEPAVNVEDLSPPNRELLSEAMPGGELVNVLYEAGERLDTGFRRERRCFALGERGWLAFVGWDGRPAADPSCRSRWALTQEAQALLRERA